MIPAWSKIKTYQPPPAPPPVIVTERKKRLVKVEAYAWVDDN